VGRDSDQSFRCYDLHDLGSGAHAHDRLSALRRRHESGGTTRAQPARRASFDGPRPDHVRGADVMIDEQISLTVDGKLYVSWVEVNIERSLDRFAHSFRLTYIDRWSDHVEPWPIRTGAACQVKFGKHILVTGYVDVATFTVDAKSWTLTAAGRSKTGDLVDCSAIHKGGAWDNKTAKQIAEDLVAPFGLTVAQQTPDPEVLPRFAIMEGESVHDALDRLVKNRGFLCHTLADGNVGMLQLLQFVGDVYHLPVDEAIDRDFSEDMQERFSEYRLRSQTSAVATNGDPVTVTRK